MLAAVSVSAACGMISRQFARCGLVTEAIGLWVSGLS